MRIYTCPACSGVLYFRSLSCACGMAVGYDPAADAFRTDGSFCSNRDEIECNWAAPEPGALCTACDMTEVRPDTDVGENRQLWADAEAAKRWVLANLARWGWFTARDSGPRPECRLLSEETAKGEVDVMMGHAAGVVTINVTEADPVERITRREALGERLRTMTGHFRHELAHFLYLRLSGNAAFHDGFRTLFGNESVNYTAALKRYYAHGAHAGWRDTHITRYASAHPHEDWAESCAHILHLTDLVDSLNATGLSGPNLPDAGYDAYTDEDAARLIGYGVEVGLALNHINRSIGLGDGYPFVLNDAARRKLAFAHHWLSKGPEAV